MKIEDFTKDQQDAQFEDSDGIDTSEFNWIEINCGIGVIKYLEPDEIKLQLLMEEFKERQERVLF